MSYPEELRYTAEHEWVSGPDEDGIVRIGITSYAQEALGDIVYVSVSAVGSDVSPGDSLGEVESTKSVSDVYAPLAGAVVARNERLDAQPELLNSDPYGDGWIAELRPADPASLDGLLDAAAYGASVSQG
ncbi:MAG TPA: glycine cleavage system protein GcvH [Frankiaceae bacterium]|nr:glycine cleavage system protein GcvH [Frankiaceae bacterium]